jgi:hypothetical protein
VPEFVAQEVFVRVFRKLGNLCGDGPFDAWPPFARPGVVASSAIAAARRRRLALFYRGGLVLTGIAVMVVIALSHVTRIRAAASSLAEQRFTLRCLSAERAAGIVRGGIPDPLRTSIQARGSERVLTPASPPTSARDGKNEYHAAAGAKNSVRFCLAMI